jgi:hypothetical protein
MIPLIQLSQVPVGTCPWDTLVTLPVGIPAPTNGMEAAQRLVATVATREVDEEKGRLDENSLGKKFNKVD